MQKVGSSKPLSGMTMRPSSIVSNSSELNYFSFIVRIPSLTMLVSSMLRAVVVMKHATVARINPNIKRDENPSR